MTIKNLEPNNEELYFNIDDVETSYVNAVRRIILSECETVGFNTDEYINSDLKILNNTTSLHNEFILHRIGLIPINISDTLNYDSSKYKFILEKDNKTNELVMVTTEDFKVINTETNKEERSITFFPPNKLTGEYILILKLKPNPNLIGEKINITGVSSKSSGGKNARFSPVSCVRYTYTRDDDKLKSALEEHLKLTENESLPLIEKDKISKRFILEEGERYYKTDKNNEPNQFDFYIESIGIISPENILKESLTILYNKVLKFKNNINKIIKENISVEGVSLMESLETMKAYSINIENETHTLGNLLQTYISKIGNEKIQFVGYKNPHPLKNVIELKVSLKNHTKEELNDIIDETCNYLLKLIDLDKNIVINHFTIKKPLKIKKKSKAS